jgi:hypothetical protein
MHRDWKEKSDGQVGRRMDIRLGQIQPRRSRAKRRQFSIRVSTPPGSREKRSRYHSRCSRSVASAAIRIMSALGQKQTCAVQYLMSALHPKADMCGATGDVRFVPIADIAALLDHLVGACNQRRRYGEALRLGLGKFCPGAFYWVQVSTLGSIKALFCDGQHS